MTDYHQSFIWKKTLADQPVGDEFKEQRGFLRTGFERFHEKAKLLAEEISIILPEYTVHNISHIDALWDTAELIVPKEFDINPAEAFVLGGAFLLHDLGMALAAYPKGIEELKQEQIWQDSIAALRKDPVNKLMEEKQIENLATEKTLRLLHAKRAGDLAKISWKNSMKQETFLIDDEELRFSFGNVIGLIAYSHCLNVDQLEDYLPPKLGALSRFPLSWTIDSVKLACILRLADAMQIDDRRAPTFLKSIRHLSNVSDLHWNFQEKLYQPRIEKNRIVYTSKSPFSIEDVDSWWTCFDTLKMIDYELKQVDSLLAGRNESLGIYGVYSIEDAIKLSKLITVEGWEPVDAKIRVDNVAKLVSSIGGTQLYGNNSIAPLRELIQNASDAIRARRLIEDEDSTYGDVKIQVGKDIHGDYLEVEDNGIGMSSKVLVGPFLDFGQSFWSTDLMHEELPGLESKGYKSTGKYGIGFFSLFMWGDQISVYTNRYNKGREDTLVLEFKNGVSARPILRKAKTGEYIRNGGTRIRIWLKKGIMNSLISYSFPNERKGGKSLSKVIERLCPSIDCNVWIMESKKYKKIIKANDWITMPANIFLKRVLGQESYNDLKTKYEEYYKIITENIDIIKDQNNEIVGRAALFHDDYGLRKYVNLDGMVTVGGFKTTNLAGFVGILVGESERASRDIGIPVIQMKDLCAWVNAQIVKLETKGISVMDQLEIAEICRAAIGKAGYLKIAEHKNGPMNFEEVREYVKKQEYDQYILISDSSKHIYERDKSTKISLNGNVFSASCGVPCVLQANTYGRLVMWPQNMDTSRFDNHTLRGLVIEAISEAWKCNIDDLYNKSDFSDDDTSFSEEIGLANGKKVIMDNVTIIRKP